MEIQGSMRPKLVESVTYDFNFHGVKFKVMGGVHFNDDFMNWHASCFLLRQYAIDDDKQDAIEKLRKKVEEIILIMIDMPESE